MPQHSLGHAWIHHDAEMPLEDHRCFAGSRLVVMCGLCGTARSYDVEKIVDRLRAKRAGGWKTPIRQVSRQMGANCPFCHRHAWRSQLAYPETVTEQEARRLARQMRS